MSSQLTTTAALLEPATHTENPAGGLPDRSPMVEFCVDDLVTGRQLKCPIYDKGNLLLLAEGAIVTPRFKQLLLSRGIHDVMLSQMDADGMVSQDQPAGRMSGIIQVEADLTKKIDELIDSGQLFMENAGPKLKDRLVLHGCKGYNVEQRESLLKQHSETCSALDNLIKAAIHGQSLSGEDIATIVSGCLTSLTCDADCVIDVACQAGHYVAIAERCLQMSLLGMTLAIEMGLSDSDIRNVGLSGMLHDWGMSLIPPEILDAKRVLTQREFLEIQKHPIHTLDLLRSISGIPDFVKMICYQVHERPNGTGYPRGRKRTSIHPCARILHVVDVYLALTSARPFRKALMPYAAIECLLRQAKESLVDVEVVRALLHVVSLFPIGSLVNLSDGSTARVLRRNGSNYSSPIVQILKDASGEPTDLLDESTIIDPSLQKLKIVKAVPATDNEQIAIDSSALQIMRV